MTHRTYQPTQGDAMAPIGHRHTRTVLALTAGLLLAATAAAAPAPKKDDAAKDDSAKTVTVTFFEIHASKEEKEHIDPALQAIADELKHSKYNCFRLGVTKTQAVVLGKVWELALREDHAARVQPKEVKDDSVVLVMSWVRYEKDDKGERKCKELLSIPMTLRKGKYLLSGGWKLSTGALMGAVAVK